MYYIYEIPGVKVGCTTRPKIRVQTEQKFSNWIILEQHEDIMVASTRERELQKEKGYKVDSRPYYETISLCSSAGKSNSYENKMIAARLGGIKSSQNITEKGRMDRRKGGTIVSSRVHTCPICGKAGKGPSMFRYHFDQCKEKP